MTIDVSAQLNQKIIKKIQKKINITASHEETATSSSPAKQCLPTLHVWNRFCQGTELGTTYLDLNAVQNATSIVVRLNSYTVSIYSEGALHRVIPFKQVQTVCTKKIKIVEI